MLYKRRIIKHSTCFITHFIHFTGAVTYILFSQSRGHWWYRRKKIKMKENTGKREKRWEVFNRFVHAWHRNGYRITAQLAVEGLGGVSALCQAWTPASFRGGSQMIHALYKDMNTTRRCVLSVAKKEI